MGALLAATCLVQHGMIKGNWLVVPMAFAYILIIAAYIILAVQSRFGPIALIVSTSFSLILELLLLTNGIYSLVVLILLIYSVVILVMLYTGPIPALLVRKARLKKAEEDEWVGKI